MTSLIRTDSTHLHFIELVKLLDAELAIIDGSEHSFYSAYNKIDKIKHAVVAYNNDRPVACGAIKEFNTDSVEIKRMYTIKEARGKRIATTVLHELEKWAAELNYKTCVLETGKRQADAVALYQKNGYTIIPNYGQYAGIENSVCFEKILS